MKTIIAFTLLLTFSSAQATDEYQLADGTVLKNADQSIAAQLCFAAIDSKEALKLKARELKVGARTLRKVLCNATSLVEFAKHYNENMREWSIATVQ